MGTGRGIFVISVSSINPVIKSQDNHLFAKKLDKNLLEIAKEGDKNAKSFDKLWAEKARRAVLKKIMDEWVTTSKQNKKPTVERLLSALSVPGFMDVKFRVENLLAKNFSSA